MGVPKQVVEMEAEGDKEIAAGEAKPTGVQPTAPTAASEPPKAEVAENPAEPQTTAKASLLSQMATTDAAAEEERKRAAREASAAGRLHDLMGKLSTQRDAYEKRIAELEGRITELDGRLKEASTARPQMRDDATDDEIFAEIRKEYGEEDYSDEDLKRFISVIQRVGNSALRPIRQRFDEMDAERADRAKRAAQAEADSFVAKLNADFPGFREMDANNDPRWISFLSTSLGGVMEGTSYGDVAKDALKALDYRKFSAVVREFAKQSNIVFSANNKPSDGGVAGQIRPTSAAAPKRVSTQAQPTVVPMAEIEAFRRAAFAHKAEERYGMTHAQVVERLRFYEDAEAEGRVR